MRIKCLKQLEHLPGKEDDRYAPSLEIKPYPKTTYGRKRSHINGHFANSIDILEI
jgi:hypothetical protein